MSRDLLDIVIWGATGQARVLNEFLLAVGYRLVALFDNNPQIATPFADVPLFYGEHGFSQWAEQRDPHRFCGFVVAIGGDRGHDRLVLFERLESAGLQPVTALHPTAFVATNATIGPGSQLLAQSAVCAEATLGRCCIINTGASIDHECRLGDGVHIGPGARLAGCVEVGALSMIGTGAVVAPNIAIGEGAVVGAGAVVIKDVDANAIVVGNPARPMLRKAGSQ